MTRKFVVSTWYRHGCAQHNTGIALKTHKTIRYRARLAGALSKRQGNIVVFVFGIIERDVDVEKWCIPQKTQRMKVEVFSKTSYKLVIYY